MAETSKLLASFRTCCTMFQNRVHRLNYDYIRQGKGEHDMLRWSVILLVIALIAGIFGFFNVVAAAAGIAKVLFYIFLVLFVISLFTGRRGRSM
jgi:uncharacterized membrane protein YtjA (UPF0391 family)